MTIASKNRKGEMGPEHVKTLEKAVTTDGAQTITGQKFITLGSSTAAATWFGLSPNNYSSGNPGLFFDKSSTASEWQLVIYDGTIVGTLNIRSTNLQHNGIAVALDNLTVIGSDADVTYTSTYRKVLHSGTLTANRTVTLPSASSVKAGTTIRTSRTGAGAFTLNTPGKNLSQYQWVEHTSDGGSTWFVSAYGAL